MQQYGVIMPANACAWKGELNSAREKILINPFIIIIKIIYSVRLGTSLKAYLILLGQKISSFSVKACLTQLTLDK